MLALKVCFSKVLLLLFLFAPGPALAQDGPSVPPVPLESVETRQDARSVPVLTYFGIGETGDTPSTLDFGSFYAQMSLLAQEGHTVVPLDRVVQAALDGADLPPGAVALTFDGGRRSILEQAIPLLISQGLPFAIFFNPEAVDRHDPGVLKWSDLKTLAGLPNIALGIAPSAASGASATVQDAGEMRRRLNTARTRFREELGSEPRFLAWPSGLYSASDREVVASQGFAAAFGQHPGPVSPSDNRFALPRFAVTQDEATLEHFRTFVRSLPLHATDLVPSAPVGNGAMPDIGFSVPAALADRRALLSCFIEGVGRVTPQSVGSRRVEVRFPSPPDPGPSAIRCTLPSDVEDQDGAFRTRWIGFLVEIPSAVPPQPPAVNPAPPGPR